MTGLPSTISSSVAEGQDDLVALYGCSPCRFNGTDEALHERRLVFGFIVDPKDAETRARFEAASRRLDRGWRSVMEARTCRPDRAPNH